MAPSGSFGPFEIVSELYTGAGATVYKARKEGDPKGEYILKVFSLERHVSEAAEEVIPELEPLFKDLGASFTNQVNLQKGAGDSSPYFTPILAAGHDERGAWYATHFYARSVQGLLERLVALEPADLFHVIQSVLQAALHLKKTAGRSHGNLKPSNIFIEGVRKPTSSRVLVSEPLPGGPEEAQRYEKADLRALGELIYQLALKRRVDFTWVMVPVEPSADWTRLFGKQTKGWLSLCNLLLDPNLSLDNVTLERVEGELRKLKPKLPLIYIIAPAVVVLIIAGLVALFARPSTSKPDLYVTTDPPGARIDVFFKDTTDLVGNNDNAAKALRFSKPLLAHQGYDVGAHYPGLEPVSTNVTLRLGKNELHLKFSYGKLIVETLPPKAKFTLGAYSNTTPHTFEVFRPGETNLEFALDGYKPCPTNFTVQPHATTMVQATLAPLEPGQKNIEFSSDPPGAEITVSRPDGEVVGRVLPAGSKTLTLSDGRHKVTANLPGFPPQTSTLDVVVRKGEKTSEPSKLYFPHGSLTISTSFPPALSVLVKDLGTSLTNQLQFTSPRDLLLPTGQIELTFTAPGYKAYKTSLDIADKWKGELRPAPILEAVEGFVELSTDPPGAQILDQAGQVLTTTPYGPILIPLRPGSNITLIATYGNLKQIEKKGLTVEAGKTNNRLGKLTFDYGTVIFTNITPASATVELSGTTIPRGLPIFQRPDVATNYFVKADRYVPKTIAIAVAQHATTNVALTLDRQTVPVALVSDPEKVDFFYVLDGSQKAVIPSGTNYLLPWVDDLKIIASHRRLGERFQTTAIPLPGPSPLQFKFDYGTLVLTNLPNDMGVYESNAVAKTYEMVGSGGDEQVFEPIRQHSYVVAWKSTPNNVITNPSFAVELRGRYVLPACGAPKHPNGIGMFFVQVKDLLGPGADAWVGETEVTQEQWEKLMGRQWEDQWKTLFGKGTSGPVKGPDLPVYGVTWDQAMEFCNKLNKDCRKPPYFERGEYRLPNLDEWTKLADVSGTGLSNALRKAVWSTNSAAPLDRPAPVRSMGPNSKSLCDVLGNVREWLSTTDSDPGTARQYVGGSFKTIPGMRGPSERATLFLKPQSLEKSATAVDLGLRVIWIPSR